MIVNLRDYYQEHAVINSEQVEHCLDMFDLTLDDRWLEAAHDWALSWRAYTDILARMVQ
jgi:hypothetical protein